MGSNSAFKRLIVNSKINKKNSFSALEYKKEIEDYLEESGTEEHTTENTWLHFKQ